MGATSRKNQALKPFTESTDPIRNLPGSEKLHFPQNQKKKQAPQPGRGAIKSGEESSVRKEVAKAREEERSGKSL
jgi:hypothetical protein